MKLGLALALVLGGVAASVPGYAQSAPEPAVVTVPKPFLDCSNAWRVAAKEVEEPEAYRCTRDFFETLPGSGGSTYDMSMASARAAEAADLYIDSVLVPEIVQGLSGDESAGRKAQGITRDFLLRSYVRSARGAGATLCEIQYDYHSEGTIRSVVGGSCAVENRDRLIGDLMRLAFMVGTH
jgi:hypothetical protein